MINRLKGIQTPYIHAQTLLNLLADYVNPRECISRMVKKGELIRLKNGFYLIADKIEAEGSLPYEQIANLLYGPSYVSLEWALSFYGMIPERVVSITSMTLGRDKEFETPIGHFSYYRLSSKCYSIGVTQLSAVDFVGNFLIATREKSLADLVYKRCKSLDKNSLKKELLESKRMDEIHLRGLNKELLAEIAEHYRSSSVHSLVNLLGTL